MKNSTRLRHCKRLRKRHQSYRRMEFYSDHVMTSSSQEQEQAGANCHWPQEDQTQKSQLNKKSA